MIEDEDTVTEPVDAELRVPAESAYVSVLRMTAAGLAARVDFTIDDIEDLRMAVGEACALLLDSGVGEQLRGLFAIDGRRLTVTVTVDAPGSPDRDSFAWQVITSLATDVGVTDDDRRRSISFTITGSKI